MLRIKLFALFIAYALVALVRPREMRKMLEAADRGAEIKDTPIEYPRAAYERLTREYALWLASQECSLPPAGWRCTRRAGHDGPCAAVAK